MSQQKEEETRNLSQSDFNITKLFREYLLTIEMKKTVYLGLSILELRKILMNKFWYDYVEPKYGEKAKLGYMDTDSFTVYIKT